MKLIGSYTSPFVRKISVILLEKAIPFEFVNEFPYHETNGVAQYNPLGKVPALVTDDGDCWYDSPIIAQYLELLGIGPAMRVTERCALMRLIWRPFPQPAPSLISISAASRQAGAPPDRSWSVWWIPSFSAPALRAPNRR